MYIYIGTLSAERLANMATPKTKDGKYVPRTHRDMSSTNSVRSGTARSRSRSHRSASSLNNTRRGNQTARGKTAGGRPGGGAPQAPKNSLKANNNAAFKMNQTAKDKKIQLVEQLLKGEAELSKNEPVNHDVNTLEKKDDIERAIDAASRLYVKPKRPNKTQSARKFTRTR